jgi:hypothetical protein
VTAPSTTSAIQFRFERPYDEKLEIYLGDELIAAVNHDEHGWDGMEAVENAMLRLEAVLAQQGLMLARAPTAPGAPAPSVSEDDVACANRYRFLRDDQDWPQCDRFWEALQNGGALLDKALDEALADRARSTEAG